MFRLPLLALSALTLVGCANVQILDKEPAGGDLAYKKVVYVDDGSCPSGQIKELTGGNNNIDVDRKRRCIPRPK